MLLPMTQARSLLVPANAHGVYHCVSRCVRRAWLCGQDPLTGADHEHRRQWVEDRLALLAELYAVSIWAYAVMSNHLHVVIEMHADVARDWGPDEVAVRWLELYPPEDGQLTKARTRANWRLSDTDVRTFRQRALAVSAMLLPMTQARSLLVPANAHGVYHCVSRCVRRAWLCGRDPLTGVDHEHRRQWVEDRLAQLADLYAVSIWAYAVMSNHLHVVIEMHADVARDWDPDEVAVRWLGLYPPEDGQFEEAKAQIVANDARLAVLRARLCSLSWFMKSLSEPIARRANVEDHCKGRFWEGRFRSQVLLDETAVLSAMTYVDLNPIRAGMTADLEGSVHTSILKHIRVIESGSLSESPRRMAEGDSPRVSARDKCGPVLAPVLGIRGLSVTALSCTEYIELVDITGREWHPTKRGRITGQPPVVLRRMGMDASQWTDRVRAVKPEQGFSRVIGSEGALIDKAAEIGQRWLRGLGVARSLAN